MQNEERAPAELLRCRFGPTEPEGKSWSQVLQGHPALCYQNFPEIQEITATTSFFVTQNKMSLDTSARSRATRLLDQGLSWITPAAQKHLFTYKQKAKEATTSSAASQHICLFGCTLPSVPFLNTVVWRKRCSAIIHTSLCSTRK